MNIIILATITIPTNGPCKKYQNASEMNQPKCHQAGLEEDWSELQFPPMSPRIFESRTAFKHLKGKKSGNTFRWWYTVQAMVSCSGFPLTWIIPVTQCANFCCFLPSSAFMESAVTARRWRPWQNNLFPVRSQMPWLRSGKRVFSPNETCPKDWNILHSIFYVPHSIHFNQHHYDNNNNDNNST